MDLNNNKPIYIQIVNKIESLIISGKLKTNDKVLSLREMSNILNVNPNTVANAYYLLCIKDVLYKKNGLGYFVKCTTKDIDYLKNKELEKILNSFINSMILLEFSNDQILNILQTTLAKELNFTEHSTTKVDKIMKYL